MFRQIKSFKAKRPDAYFQVCLLTVLTFLPLAVRAQTVDNRTAKYFDVGKTADAPLFTQTIRIETALSGDRSWYSETKDAAGTILIVETALIKANKVVTQTVDNSQLHETYVLEVGAEKANYKTFRFVDGKRGELIEEKNRSKEDNFVTGPSVEFYLSQKWDEFNADKVVEVEFGVVEVSRSIGFDFKKEGETEQLLKVKMKPSNFFISLVVDPLHLEFDKLTKHLVRYKGRTSLRRMRDGKLKSWDAEIVYE